MIEIDFSRVEALSQAAQWLPNRRRYTVLKEALAQAATLGSWLGGNESRADAVRIIAARLPSEATDLDKEVLRNARLLANDGGAASLQFIALRWAKVCQVSKSDEITELYATLRVFSNARRRELLEALKWLAPVIARLGGERAVRETTQAIIDTAKWWP
jgi:hypothetical protein